MTQIRIYPQKPFLSFTLIRVWKKELRTFQKTQFMNFVLKPITIIAFTFLCCLSSLQGQQRCYVFDDLEVNKRIAADQDDLPSEVIGTEFGMNISAELFIGADRNFLFEEMKVVDEDFENDFIHGQNLSIALRNISVKFDFSETTTEHHLIQLHGFNIDGGFNMSVNSEVSRFYSSLEEIPSFPLPGVTFQSIEVASEDGSGVHFVATLISNEPIRSLTFGGENIVIDNVCYNSIPESECRIYNPMNVPMCGSGDSLSVDLYLNHTLANPVVIVRLNGLDLGKQDFSDDKIELRNIAKLDLLPEELIFEFEGLDDGCTWSMTTQKPNCVPPVSNDCEISEPDLQFTLCDENGDFYALLNFDTINVNDSFNIRVSAGYNQDFAYTELPITLALNDSLPWITSDNLDWTVQLRDLKNSQCSTVFNANGNTLCNSGCGYTNLTIDDVICQPNFDSVSLSFNFDTIAPTTDSFGVLLDNQFIGNFGFNQLPIQSFPALNSGREIHSLTIFEYVGQPYPQSCQNTIHFATPCRNCPSNLSATLNSIPDQNGDYSFEIDLTQPADTSGRFELFLNSELIDTFRYRALPIRQNFNCLNLSDTINVSIVGLDSLGCSDSTILVINCDSVCYVPNFQAKAIDCTPTNFDLQLNFDPTNNPVEVKVSVNGSPVGSNMVADSLLFTNIPIQTTANLEIEVCETNNPNPDCCTFIQIPNPCSIPQCEIEILSAIASACDPDGMFIIDLELNANNPLGNSFIIFVNGVLQTTENYSSNIQQFQIGPFDGTLTDDFQITIIDVINSDCSAAFDLSSPNCNPNPCTISDVEAEVVDCSDFDYSLKIEFEYENQESIFFELWIDGENVGFFPYNAIPLTLNNLPKNSNTEINIQINDLDNPSCLASALVSNVCNDCKISNFKVEPQACNNDQEFNFLINAEIDAIPTDTFYIIINNQKYAELRFLDLASLATDGILVGGFDGSTLNGYTVEIRSVKYGFCVVDTTLQYLCPPPPSCEISEFTLDVSDCDQDGNYFVEVDFRVQNSVVDSFSLFVNGLLLNRFSYSNLPLTVGPYFADGEQMRFNVRDVLDFDCGANGQFIEENCIPPCEIKALILEPSICDNNGAYILTVDATVENSTSNIFSLYLNGTLEGNYNYSQLPLDIGPLSGNNQTNDVEIRDGADLDCRIGGSYQAPFCPLPCSMANLIAQPQACDPDGNFLMDIDFDLLNSVSDSFLVSINGAEYGTFSVDQTRRTIGPFPGNGSVLNVSVADKIDLNCNTSISFQSPDCVVIECQLWDFKATPFPCDQSQQYELELSFQHRDASNEFELIQDGNSLGNFNYADLNLILGPFDGDGSQIDFEIIDSDDNDCRLQGSVESPICTPPCDLRDLQITQNDCDPDGNFTFQLGFRQNFASDSFNLELIGANGFQAKYSYIDLPITVGPFNGDDVTNYAFSISDFESPACRLEFTVLAVDCLCELSNIEASPTVCDANQNYSINLEFSYENAGESFLLEGNGFSQVYNYEEMPLVFGNFPGDDQSYTYTITDQNRSDCTLQFVVDGPDCVPPCELNSPEIIETICDNQGMFDAIIDFEYHNTGSAFMLNGDIYTYASLPVRIGPFVGDGATTQNLTITDLDNPDCSLPLTIPVSFCGDSCNITNLKTSVTACDSLGNFDLALEFDFDNTNQSGFRVTVNGISAGSFPYNVPQPIALGSFPGNNVSVYNVAVLDLEDSECNASTKVGPVNCLPCEFLNLTTPITDCDSDGNFTVWVGFDAQNGSNSGFSIRGNGINYGSYSYDTDIPTLLGPFSGDGTSVYEFQITDNGDSDCFIETTVGPVECETNNCRIFNLSANPTDCNADGEFFVDLRFEFEDVGNSGFTVRGNGMIYGLFDYSDPTVQLGPFVGDGNTEYEFIVIDNDNPDCLNFTSIGSIDCNEFDCNITNLNVELGDCNGDGTYMVGVDFDFQNPISNTFELHTTRGLFGIYSLSDLPLTIPNFEINGNPFDAVRVCFSGSHTCCASSFFPTPECDGDCIEFDALPAGLSFDLNESIFDTVILENNVLVTTNFLFGEDGSIKKDSVFIEESSAFFDASYGVQLTTINSTVEFEFPDFTSSPCREVTINYFQEGDFNNISINGQPTRIFSNFEELPFEIADAVIVEIFPTNSREGSIKLKGFINNVRIGGDNLSIDNICYNGCEITNSVWPGDINLDNLVSNLDVLNLGVAYGTQGPSRDMISTNWEELPADDWLRFFGRFQNYKHGDCNGDGIIDINDLLVIDGNYGSFNEPIVEFPPEIPPVSAPRMYIEYPDPSTIEPNTPFTMRLMLGEADNQVFNLYGLAFNLRFDENQFQLLNIKYPPSWFGEVGEDLITVDRIFGNEGVAHVGMSRINQENVTDFGLVAELDGIIIIDDIVQRQGSIDMEVDGIVSINKDELTVPINGSVSTLDFTMSSTINTAIGKLEVYPNPTKELVYFDLDKDQKVEQVEILSSDGKMLQQTIPEANSISLEHFTPGVYTLRFLIDGNIYYDRIIKQ